MNLAALHAYADRLDTITRKLITHMDVRDVTLDEATTPQLLEALSQRFEASVVVGIRDTGHEGPRLSISHHGNNAFQAIGLLHCAASEIATEIYPVTEE